jgi:predicted permease
MQTAVSLLLLISAGLFAKTLVNLSRIELGIQTDRLMTFSLTPKLNGYSEERVMQLYQQLTERLSAIPGVALVSTARVPAIAGDSSSGNITVEGFTPRQDEDADSHLNAVGPGYFRTLGIPLVVGREFTPADHGSAPKVAIVNESFVRHFLAGRNPIGVRMARGAGNNIKLNTTIVGVVKDAKYSDMRETPPRTYYTPYLQSPRQSAMYFYVRTAIEPEHVASSIRREVVALDPNLPIRELKTMRAQIESNMANERLLSMLTGSFAALATLLAATGLYGVLAYSVQRRTREIGIRMALGANAGHVRGLVAREVLLMLAIGGVAGLASAAAVGQFIQSVLFGIKPWDPLVYGSAALVLGVIALGAAYVPTRRAMTVDPMIALRYE